MTTYEYDDHGRVARALSQSPWTPEDRALMLALNVYNAGNCPNCGHPKATAWHPDNEGWFEVVQTYECNACTALRQHAAPDEQPVEFVVVDDTRDYEANPLPPMPMAPRLTNDELTDAMGGAV